MSPAPVVLLPAIGMTSSSWPQLALRPARLIHAVDYPGFGRRADASALRTLDAMADDVARTLAAFDRPCHVVGVSMGGMVAQHLATRHPALIRSLMLVATSAHTPTNALTARAAELERLGQSPTMIETTIERWFTAASIQVPGHEGVQRARQNLEASDPLNLAICWRAMANHDHRRELATVNAPATCLAGASDESTPPSVLRELAEALGHPRLRVIESAHMIPLEQPAAFAEEVKSHLKWAERNYEDASSHS